MAKLILIVDDSAAVRHKLGATLRDAGYEVLEACDGQDALHRLDGRKINLIVSDLYMPNLDGLALLREVKNLPGYRFTPVIVLTTERHESWKQEGQRTGAKAWVVKPFKPERLLTAVAKLMSP
jgi:two-component system chemotaxis response regulator CheY